MTLNRSFSCRSAESDKINRNQGVCCSLSPETVEIQQCHMHVSSCRLGHMQDFTLVLSEINHQIFLILVLGIFISLWSEKLLDSVILSIKTATHEYLLFPGHNPLSPSSSPISTYLISEVFYWPQKMKLCCYLARWVLYSWATSTTLHNLSNAHLPRCIFYSWVLSSNNFSHSICLNISLWVKQHILMASAD